MQNSIIYTNDIAVSSWKSSKILIDCLMSFNLQSWKNIWKKTAIEVH